MLANLLVSEIFAFLLIFTRMGTALMVMPGFGEVFVSARIRLVFALLFSLALGVKLAPFMPTVPNQPVELVPLIASEMLIGLFIGMLMRFLMAAMHIAATAVATQSGFANAMMFDLTMSGQTTTITNLLTFASIVVIFSMNLHHAMLMGVVSSYEVFPPSAPLMLGDMADMGSRYVNHAFVIALQIASPFIVAGIILNLGGGILSRLMPNLQIFFILMSPQIMLALFVLMVSVSSMMLLYAGYVEEGLKTFLVPES